MRRTPSRCCQTGKPRQPALAQQLQRLRHRGFRRNRHRLRQRPRDLPHRQILQIEHAVDHRPLLRAEHLLGFLRRPAAVPRDCQTDGRQNVFPPVHRSNSREPHSTTATSGRSPMCNTRNGRASSQAQPVRIACGTASSAADRRTCRTPAPPATNHSPNQPDRNARPDHAAWKRTSPAPRSSPACSPPQSSRESFPGSPGIDAAPAPRTARPHLLPDAQPAQRKHPRLHAPKTRPDTTRAMAAANRTDINANSKSERWFWFAAVSLFHLFLHQQFPHPPFIHRLRREFQARETSPTRPPPAPHPAISPATRPSFHARPPPPSSGYSRRKSSSRIVPFTRQRPGPSFSITNPSASNAR